jgi:hypothetical protein
VGFVDTDGHTRDHYRLIDACCCSHTLSLDQNNEVWLCIDNMEANVVT